MTRGADCHLFRGAADHNLSTFLAGFRTEIDYPIGRSNQVEVML